jgi:drug/metabolite transporter (DMT)-like permease
MTATTPSAGRGPTAVGDGRRTLLLFVVASLTFGTGFVGIKTGLADVPPLLFAALRYDVGAAVLLTYVLLRGGYWRPVIRADWLAVAVAGALLSGLNAALLFLGQQYLTAGTAAVLFGLVPVLAPLFALALLPGTRVDPVGVVGILVGLVGVVAIVGPDGLTTTGDTTRLGVALVGAAAVLVALGSVLLRRIERGLPGLAMTAWALAVAALLVHLLSLSVGETPADVRPTRTALLAVLWVGLPATALAFPAYYGLIDRAGPVRANLISYAVPPVATVTGVLVLGEAIQAGTVLGFLLVVVGFGLVERENLRRELRRLRGRRVRRAPSDDQHRCESAPRG